MNNENSQPTEATAAPRASDCSHADDTLEAVQGGKPYTLRSHMTMLEACERLHTPGPWKVSRRFDIYEDTQTPGVGGTYIGTTRGNGELPESINVRCEADAALMADAPAMLEALRELLVFAEADEHHRYHERSKAAFDRAYGILERHGG